MNHIEPHPPEVPQEDPDDLGTSLLFPLKINEGTSRYKAGVFYYLVDQAGKTLAGTQNPEKLAYWRELVAVTEKLLTGDIEVEAVRYAVGVRVV